MSEKHIRVAMDDTDHTGHKARALNLPANLEAPGVRAIYCINCNRIITYLFKAADWSVEKAREWTEDHRQLYKQLNRIEVDQEKEFLKVIGTRQDDTTDIIFPNTPSFELTPEMAGYATGKEDRMVTCKKCNTEFDWTKEPEVSMGAVKCPKCGVAIDQEGNAYEGGLEIVKVDKDKQIVYGVFLWPEKADHDGDVLSAEDIEKVAHGFMADYRTIDEMHRQVIKADIVESAIAWKDDLEYHGKKLKRGVWFGAVHVTDKDVWEKVKDGTYKGFSVRISGQRELIEKGGPGSGHFGHEGVPGQQGGSAPGEGGGGTVDERVTRAGKPFKDFIAREYKVPWHTLSDETLREALDAYEASKKGGPGSGNFGHEGVPGQQGGSAPGGGDGRSGEAAPDGKEVKSIATKAVDGLTHQELHGDMHAVWTAKHTGTEYSGDNKETMFVNFRLNRDGNTDAGREAMAQKVMDAMPQKIGDYGKVAHGGSTEDNRNIHVQYYNPKTGKSEKGGAGSGNWGHAGVPGEQGGSAPGGGGSPKITTPDLRSVDIDRLDPIEQREYARMANRKENPLGKEHALQVIVNSVEGDFSQLSPQLRERAERDESYKKGGPGSGHHGHEGVPGQQGGSAPGGGGQGSVRDAAIESRARKINVPEPIFRNAVEQRAQGRSYEEIVENITQHSREGQRWWNSAERKETFHGDEDFLRRGLQDAIQPEGRGRLALVPRYEGDGLVV